MIYKLEEKGQKMKSKDLRKEKYRRYEWIDPATGNAVMHIIQEPVVLYRGKTTHRILDTNGLVHFVPSVGYFGCVLLTENKDKNPTPDVDGITNEKKQF